MSGGACWRQLQEQEEQQLWELQEATMFCDENFGDKRVAIPDSTVTGVIFIDAPHRIELWDTIDDEIFYGAVPADYTQDQIKVAIRFYRDGYEFGEKRSRERIQRKVLKALEIFDDE